MAADESTAKLSCHESLNMDEEDLLNAIYFALLKKNQNQLKTSILLSNQQRIDNLKTSLLSEMKSLRDEFFMEVGKIVSKFGTLNKRSGRTREWLGNAIQTLHGQFYCGL